jgi:hypothetical protein
LGESGDWVSIKQGGPASDWSDEQSGFHAVAVLAPHHAPIHFDLHEVAILMHPALGTRGVVDSWFGRFCRCSPRD